MDDRWGTVAYAVAAGINAGFGVVLLLDGLHRRRRDQVAVLSGVWAALSALQALVTLALHRSVDVDGYSSVFVVWVVFLIANGCLGIVIGCTWASGAPARSPIAYVAVAALSVLVVLAVSDGSSVAALRPLRTVALFGESFVVQAGGASAWRLLATAWLLVGAAMVAHAVGRRTRVDRASGPTWIVIGGSGVVAAALHDLLVDLGRVDTPYLWPFATVAATVAASVMLAMERVGREGRLRDQTVRLESMIGDRTARLMEANRGLEAQLERQRRAVVDLRALTTAFDRTNAVVDVSTGDLDAMLSQLLGELGTAVEADCVELRVDASLAAETGVRSAGWHRSTDVSAVAECTTTSEPIQVAGQRVGDLVVAVGPTGGQRREAAELVELVGEHIGGLLHRLALTRRLADDAVESERRRIAMELHDSVTQRLYSVSYLADAAGHLGGDRSHETDDVVDVVGRIREMVLSSLAELRAQLIELRPEAFEDETLASLLTGLVDALRASEGTPVALEAEEPPGLSATAKWGSYRIAREAVDRARRRGGAGLITVRLEPGGDHAVLTVHDDGEASDLGRSAAGEELAASFERARSIGAHLAVTSRAGEGTTVEVRVPLAAPHRRHGKVMG